MLSTLILYKVGRYTKSKQLNIWSGLVEPGDGDVGWGVGADPHIFVDLEAKPVLTIK